MSDSSELQNLLSRKWIAARCWEGFLNYSHKNVEAMTKGYEKTEIPPELAEEVKAWDGEARLLLIGADWCGDVVANAPAIARLADLNPKIQLRVIDRDTHDDLMQLFLTNGTKSIPKLILCPSGMGSHAQWGPRPSACQAIMTENKGNKPKEEIRDMLRAWYKQDKSQTVLKEIWEGIKAIGNGN
ncbi:thioredoxin family protein [Candidatus Sumerlaeota bacterium]|nr:thioredoxin family protein [Candidatus Sumerlaeota bacterium]